MALRYEFEIKHTLHLSRLLCDALKLYSFLKIQTFPHYLYICYGEWGRHFDINYCRYKTANKRKSHDN